VKRHVTRAAAGVGAAALLVSTLLVTASSAQAADGTLVVTVVDQYGRPTPGILYAYDSVANQQAETTPTPGGSATHTYTVAPGGYGFQGITPWSGVSCDGVAPCGLTATVTTVTPVVTVGDGTTSTYTVRITVPSITGTPAVDSPLAIQIPPALAAFQALVASTPGYGGSMTQQWVRGTTDIAGATGTSYTTVKDDGVQAVSARLIPSPGMIIVFSNAGMTVQPFATNAITVAKFVKFKTTTKAAIAKRIGVGERATVRVKVKAKGTKDDPDGFVTLSIGKFKTRKALKKGSVFINVPTLKAGTYTIVTKYTGSDDFKKSKAKRSTLTVG
jgi:hypothetical protein